MTVDAQPVPVEVTEDRFLGGALRIRQPLRGYRAGLDAVLLAAACPASATAAESCLDCGAGAGVAGLAAAHRVGSLRVTLLERDPTLAAMAAGNIVANGLAARVCVAIADLTKPLSGIACVQDDIGRFDHVIANPPFHAHGSGTRAADRLKDNSHAMAAGAFEAWARFAAGMLQNGGSFTIIQRPEALPEIVGALARRFGRTLVLPLHARLHQPASRLLIQATKGSRAGLSILPGRVLHAVGANAFAPEFDAILRDGAGLSMMA